MTELPKHIEEAKNKYLAKVRLQVIEEENYVKTDCKKIIEAFEILVMKHMPQNISRLYTQREGILIHGDYINLSKYFRTLSQCKNGNIDNKINELRNIVNLAGDNKKTYKLGLFEMSEEDKLNMLDYQGGTIREREELVLKLQKNTHYVAIT
jgi:hypothetical protein